MLPTKHRVLQPVAETSVLQLIPDCKWSLKLSGGRSVFRLRWRNGAMIC